MIKELTEIQYNKVKELNIQFPFMAEHDGVLKEFILTENENRYFVVAINKHEVLANILLSQSKQTGVSKDLESLLTVINGFS